MKLLRIKRNKILWCPGGPVDYVLLLLPNHICNGPLHLCTYIILVHPTRPRSSQALPGDKEIPALRVKRMWKALE